MNYLMEAGVSYRFLKDGEHPRKGEYLRSYRRYHHPSGTESFEHIVLTMDSRTLFLNLLNHWNRQPALGWSYVSVQD